MRPWLLAFVLLTSTASAQEGGPGPLPTFTPLPPLKIQSGRLTLSLGAGLTVSNSQLAVVSSAPTVNAGDLLGTTLPIGVVNSSLATFASGAAAANVGALGGDLVGTLPVPVIAPGSVTGAKLATGAAYANLGANSIDYGKLSQAPARTLSGNSGNGTANRQDLSSATVTGMLNPCAAGAQGVVPAPQTNDVVRFLGGDCAFHAVDESLLIGSTPSFTRVPASAGIVLKGNNTSGVPAYRASMAANPSEVVIGSTVFLYFRADSGNNVQTLGLMTAPAAGFDGVSNWTDRGKILDVGAGYTDGIWDPVVCPSQFLGKYWLYFQSHISPYSIWVASSTDGLTFSAPVDTGVAVGTPGCESVGGTMHLYGSVGTGLSTGGYQYVHYTSTDGINFAQSGGVSLPVAPFYGSVDYVSIEPVRAKYEAPYMYLYYGGTNNTNDYPEGLGIARGLAPFDTFEKKRSQVMLRGSAGTWDEGAIWSGAPVTVNGTRYIYWEGFGSAQTAGGSVSNSTRDTAYYQFRTTGFSQVGVAIAPADFSLANWYPDATDLPSGYYTIQNQNSGLYLSTNRATAQASAVTQQNEAAPWYVERLSNGFYRLSLAAAGQPGAQVLEIAGGSRTLSATADIYPWSIANGNQIWQMIPQAHSRPGFGTYQLQNRYSGMVLDVAGSSTSNGAAVDQYAPLNGPQQAWIFKRI